MEFLWLYNQWWTIRWFLDWILLKPHKLMSKWSVESSWLRSELQRSNTTPECHSSTQCQHTLDTPDSSPPKPVGWLSPPQAQPCKHKEGLINTTQQCVTQHWIHMYRYTLARKSRNTAAVVSPILMLLLLWSASNTLRAVDGLFLKVRHSQALAVL